MFLPNHMHFLKWDTFCFWQKLVDEESHYHHKTSKEDEQTKLQVTKHFRK
jgi:hypothetical protein